MGTFLVLLATFFVSMVPIFELKGAIPIGLIVAGEFGIKINPWIYLLVAIIGSFIPCPLIVRYLKPVLLWMSKTKLFRPLSNWVNRRFEKKSKDLEDKAEQKAEEAAQKEAGKEQNAVTAELAAENSENIIAEEAAEQEPVQAQAKIEKAKKLKLDWAKYLFLFVCCAIPLPLTGIWTSSGIASFLNLDFKKTNIVLFLGNTVAGICVMLISYFGLSLFGYNFGVNINW